MANDDSDLNPLAPRDVLQINRSPLQLPGRDERLRTSTVAGPETAGDRRMFLSVQLLEKLLDCARESPTRRAQIDYAGLRVDLYRDRNGHQYEVWTIIGAPPRPEPMPGVLQALDGGAFLG